MTFLCEDLHERGVILVPPSSAEYDSLCCDIERRIENPPHLTLGTPERLRSALVGKIPEQRDPLSAILLNQSGKTIAAIQLVWTLRETDQREKLKERTYKNMSRPLLSKTLLPFDTPGNFLNILRYWSVVLPGSKRYVSLDQFAGDNTDVRIPSPEENWKSGGIVKARAIARLSPFVRTVTLAIDGIFFSDGEFTGSNRGEMWESVTREAALRVKIARIAHSGRLRGTAAAKILRKVAEVTGAEDTSTDKWPAPPPPGKPALRHEFERRIRAFEVASHRTRLGDEATVDWLASHWDISLPNFHKN